MECTYLNYYSYGRNHYSYNKFSLALKILERYNNGEKYLGANWEKTYNRLYLANVCLRDADFNRTDFRNSVFNNADLRNVNFRRCDLRNCSFVNADLRGAILDKADMRGANFTGADMREIRDPINMTVGNKEVAVCCVEGANFTNVVVEWDKGFAMRLKQHLRTIATKESDDQINQKLPRLRS